MAEEVLFYLSVYNIKINNLAGGKFKMLPRLLPRMLPKKRIDRPIYLVSICFY